MKRAYLVVRSALLWAASGIHFAVVCTFLVFLGIFIDPRKNDWPQRAFFRNILRVAGVKFEVRRAPGFDAKRTSIFICNHVNIFDPFVIYSAIPQFVRGFELESHFKVPVYGWMMGRFGNVPVPDAPSREGLEIMTKRAKQALDSGVSLIAFAEGSRTRDGHVHEFKKGMFRIAQKFGIPIVPMSIVGSYEFFQTGNWMLHPGKITVYLHDTINPADIERADLDELRKRVQQIVAEPVEESLRNYAPREVAGEAASESIRD
ncbi:MAG TPA: lysophospholipid acyltransferase family protein [Candidatus Acidoferrales bacterium]|nr:lysophospholipid acyltransferase family protein [Candidatus Acidoferrales bacterium]